MANTAAEKAKELIDRYIDVVSDSMDVLRIQSRTRAKKCAIICVDEIISQLAEINNHESFNISKYATWWQEVKQHLIDYKV